MVQTQARRKDSVPLSIGSKKVRREMERRLGRSDAPVLYNLPQEQKISNALTTLLELDILEDDASLDQYKASLGLIAIAWNLSILVGPAREEAMATILQEMAGPDEALRGVVKEHLENLIHRKETLFPYDQRALVSWDVRLKNGSLIVSAAAVMME